MAAYALSEDEHMAACSGWTHMAVKKRRVPKYVDISTYGLAAKYTCSYIHITYCKRINFHSGLCTRA